MPTACVTLAAKGRVRSSGEREQGDGWMRPEKFQSLKEKDEGAEEAATRKEGKPDGDGRERPAGRKQA